MKNRQNKPVMLYIAAVMLLLTGISVCLTGNLLARYTVNNASGDSARVIAFGDITLTESGDFVQGASGTGYSAIFVPGVPLEKKATVHFDGAEADCYLFLKVEPSGWSVSADSYEFSAGPSGSGLSWAVDFDWTYLTTAGGAYIYYRTAAPGTTVNCSALADDRINVSENLKASDIGNLPANLSIGLSAAAVQGGGFADAAAAYAAIRQR